MIPKEMLNAKRVLREGMKAVALRHRGGDCRAHRQSLLRLPEWGEASTVLLYKPLMGEIDLMPLIQNDSSRSFLFPRIDGEKLTLYRYTPENLWIRGSFGLQEPDSGTWEKVEPHTIDLAVIPGVAFDSLGGRLGRGGGYYDRLLGHPLFRGVKVGICWPWQIVPSIPREAHDIMMDCVITGEK